MQREPTEPTVKQMEALALRWEADPPRPAQPRTAAEARLDTMYEAWKRESAPGCLPCLLEELE